MCVESEGLVPDQGVDRESDSARNRLPDARLRHAGREEHALVGAAAVAAAAAAAGAAARCAAAHATPSGYSAMRDHDQ